MANSVDPDQTAPSGAVWSGWALFANAILSGTFVHEILGNLPSNETVQMWWHCAVEIPNRPWISCIMQSEGLRGMYNCQGRQLHQYCFCLRSEEGSSLKALGANSLLLELNPPQEVLYIKESKQKLFTACHYEKMLIQMYIENFTTKNWKFSDKKTLIFFIFLLKTLIVCTH